MKDQCQICDFHVHVGERIGGYELRDSFRDLNATEGLRAIGAFVTEESGTYLGDKLQAMRKRASLEAEYQVFWHLTPVQSGVEDLLELLGEDTDLKFYTTYKDAGLYRSYEEIERWMQDLGDRKARFLVHCEDNEIIEAAATKHPFRSVRDHCRRRPEAAEIRAVEKILDMALVHSYPVHIVHVSTPAAALLIKQAKTESPLITCETAPHYLLYNESKLDGALGHRLLCSPPLRSESSRGQMVELLQDGYFDIIATDHCGFRDADKDRHKAQPEKVPCGIAGLESLWSSMDEALVKTGKIKADYLAELLSVRPAAMMNISLGG